MIMLSKSLLRVKIAVAFVVEMEEITGSTDGEIIGIKFSLATHEEISKSSINECPISHATQLANPFLGLPLETGRCESCGASAPRYCEGHFGYIKLPIPIYHPFHVLELRQMLSFLCFNCLKFKGIKLTTKKALKTGESEKMSECCQETANITVKDRKTADGESFIQLKLPAKSSFPDESWRFLKKYGYCHGEGHSRTLLPSEVLAILEQLPDGTKKKLVKKGYFPQEGYILRYLPVPPNCLSVPDMSDGVSVMCNDVASTMLKKVLRLIEMIKSTRSSEKSFKSDESDANQLQLAVSQYLQVRGAGTTSNEVGKPYGANKAATKIASKAWLEKMKTLFISKGSGSSSRSVITGETYKGVDEIGLPLEIALRITFDETVNNHNIKHLQYLLDNNYCLSFKDGVSAYSLREGSKAHTLLEPGQIVHRRIMDGDIVFINRPPTTHKHSLQALRVYIHEDHTVKINPLMCGPLGADFDGDCVHIFYPQSLPARAEVSELFSVENQLLSSHTGNLNLQISSDALLSLKKMFKRNFHNKSSAQQLSMFSRHPLASPASQYGLPLTLQILQTTFPAQFHCSGDRHSIQNSEILKMDIDGDAIQSMVNEIVTSMVFEKGPKEALRFFDFLLPLLMENLFCEGHTVSLEDFIIPSKTLLEEIQQKIQDVSPLLFQLRTTYNELIDRQIESDLRKLRNPLVEFTLTSSSLASLIDSKSESAISKIVQQIGFLGIQLHDRGKFYSRTVVDDMARLFHRNYPYRDEYPCEEFGLIKSGFFQGLDPYEELVHCIASREVIIRSSRGLAEPGILFKNLMAILRDVAICYDSTVRNVSSNFVIQFDYGVKGEKSQSLFPPGEPVGVLAATAMSNPAYSAVLDSSPSNYSSWDTMKEILFCNAKFKNEMTDRRVILYLNSCECGRKFCRENASCAVKNLLKKVCLRDNAVEFLIEYKNPSVTSDSDELGNRLVGHIHLSEDLLYESNINMHDILDKCSHEVNTIRKKKKFALFQKILLSVSESCPFSHDNKFSSATPCLKFFWKDDVQYGDNHFNKTIQDMANVICPVLLNVVVKGDPRIGTVNIIWVNPDTNTWIGKSNEHEIGELAVEVVIEREAVSKSGDPWRIVLDCCLPVFHLIDTKRVIPFSVKQIQEVLGISCAFDQAVQRLSTSVEKVAKGVLKEHLILLGSSMTSTGNLIGFNNGGIKAMYSTSGVKAPFTEATQYTPKKCFERAAEKCQLDTLSSVVASCCWGKPVAVGTGARFDVLWKEKDSPPEMERIDVYDFLNLVRNPHDEDNTTNLVCLGDDVDGLRMEHEDMVECHSPKDSRIVFEDEDTTDGWGNTTSNSGAMNLPWNSNTGISFASGWNSQCIVEERKSKNLACKYRSRGSKKSNHMTWNSGSGSQSWGGGSQRWRSGNEEFTPLEVIDEGCSGWNVRTLVRCDASQTPYDNGNGRGNRSPWKQTRGSPWKKKNQSYGRDRPPRPTRMDVYTPQENNIRSEIDPIIQSVRRIMQQEGDGVPISREDQAYIVNNVLAYHPERDAKARGGIDHIMVSKHNIFQGSRCFYVVSRDGQKQDFSYKKCMENRVKSKYPLHANSFISKYWRKPQSGGRR